MRIRLLFLCNILGAISVFLGRQSRAAIEPDLRGGPADKIMRRHRLNANKKKVHATS